MDLSTITVSDFKNEFFRDFPYLNIWDSEATYNTDDEVYYEANGLFYKCLNDGVTSAPTDTNDWTQISDSINNYVLDADIEKAFNQAKFNFNQGLFSADAEITLAYLYLTAHYLVLDLRMASQGVNSKGDYIASSQAVGNVSETLHIPESISSNKYLQGYSTTGYGLKYLNLVLPRTLGNVETVAGQTNA